MRRIASARASLVAACFVVAAVIASLLPASPAQAHVGFCASKRTNRTGCSLLQITSMHAYAIGRTRIGVEVTVQNFGVLKIVAGQVTAHQVEGGSSFSVLTCGPNACSLDGLKPGQKRTFGFLFGTNEPDPEKGQYKIEVDADGTDSNGNSVHADRSDTAAIASRWSKAEQTAIQREFYILCALAVVLTGGALLAAGALAAALWVAAAGAGVGGGIVSTIKTDPPDPNYTQIATATTPPHDAIQASGQFSQASADSANAWIDELYTSLGLLRAAATSLNRAASANQAGDATWEGNQVQAATSYLTQAAADDEQLLSRGVAFRDALISDGFSDIAITSDQITQAQQTLQGGWPATFPNSDFTTDEKAGAIAAAGSTPVHAGDSSLFDVLANGVDASGHHAFAAAMDMANTDAQTNPLSTGTSLSVIKGTMSDVTSCVGSDPTCSSEGPAPAASGASDVAVTSDGSSVLVAAPGTRSILSYDLDTSTGTLTPRAGACATDHSKWTRATGCSASVSLGDPEAIALSPDASNVYIANKSTNSITALTRDPATGALSDLGCFTDTSVTISGCAHAVGLVGPTAIVASPDGKDVYVASGGSAAVVTFTRNPATGALSFGGCEVEFDLASCDPVPGLTDVNHLSISPSGGVLAAGSTFGGTIATFTRSAAGDLTAVGCWGDSDGSCMPGQIDEVAALSFSSDGAYLYQAAFDTIQAWKVNSDGSLDSPAPLVGCTQDPGFDEVYNACIDAVGADDITAIAPTPDGKYVYTMSRGGTIASFERDSSDGALYEIGSCLTAGFDDRCDDSSLIGQSGRLAVASDGTRSYLITPGAIGTRGADDVVSAISLGMQPRPRLSINNVRRREGSNGRTRAFVFTVTLTGVTDDNISVDFDAVAGSAKAGRDFTLTPGTLHLDAPDDVPQQSVRTGTITVRVRSDRHKERNETFTVQLSNPSGAYIANGTGTGTILNDD